MIVFTKLRRYIFISIEKITKGSYKILFILFIEVKIFNGKETSFCHLKRISNILVPLVLIGSLHDKWNRARAILSRGKCLYCCVDGGLSFYVLNACQGHSRVFYWALLKARMATLKEAFEDALMEAFNVALRESYGCKSFG